MADGAFARRFGSNLARLRRQAGLSQEELGVRAAMHRTAVGQLERGERVARTDSLLKLATCLGVDPCRLLVGLSWTPVAYEPGRFGISDTDPEEEESHEKDRGKANEQEEAK